MSYSEWLKGRKLSLLMDILWTAEEDNSLIVADEKLSSLNISYSIASCLKLSQERKWNKKIFLWLESIFLKGSTLKWIGVLCSLDKRLLQVEGAKYRAERRMKQGGKVWIDFKTPRLTTGCNLKCAVSRLRFWF